MSFKVQGEFKKVVAILSVANDSIRERRDKVCGHC